LQFFRVLSKKLLQEKTGAYAPAITLVIHPSIEVSAVQFFPAPFSLHDYTPDMPTLPVPSRTNFFIIHLLFS